MPIRHVESTANPLVKELAGLKQRRERERSGDFVVEGVREARHALSAGVDVRLLVVAPALLPPGETAEAWAASARAAGADAVTFGAAAFSRVSHREHPDGVLLRARARRVAPAAVPLTHGALVLVLAGIEKPGNLGALLRTADAVGADAVFVCDDVGPGAGDTEEDGAGRGRGVDLENPNVIRAAMGSSFVLNVAVGSPGEVVGAVEGAGLRLVATTPSARLPHWDADLKGGVAIVLGREHEGLSDWWLRRAHERVTIPMRGRAADSLNVSVAGAVLLYEALRQRSG